MKSKKIWIILGIVLVIIASLIIFIFIKNNDKDVIITEDDDVHIIALYTYSNAAYGFVYYGKVIYSDGTIYAYSLNSYDEVSILEDNPTKWILENGTKSFKEVSSSDLENLKTLINDVEDVEFSTTCLGADMGSTIIDVYKDDSYINLQESGSCIGENESDTAQDILEILNKYLLDNNNVYDDTITTSDDGDVNILALYKYVGGYGEFTAIGTAIFTDGSIYNWKCNDYNLYKTFNDDVDWIITNGTKSSKNISENDLKIFNRNIKNLNSESFAYDEDYEALDVPSKTYGIYKNNEYVLLKEDSYKFGMNYSYIGQELINQIDELISLKETD